MNYKIESKNNQLIKLVQSLKLKKYRDKHKLFIIEGIKLLEEAISSDFDISFIIIKEDFHRKNEFKDFETYVVSDSIFKSLTAQKNPEGIIGVLKLNEKKYSYLSDRLLIIDGLKDPGNMGTIIRSAEAFGFNQIILVNNCVDVYNSKTIRASMGSIFRTDILEKDIEYLKTLKKEGYIMISGTPKGNVFNKITKDNLKLCLIIGSESHGISKEVLNLSDFFVKIQMFGKIESFNAAIAASILMYKVSNEK